MFKRTAILCCVVLPFVLPSSASATHVQCGDVIAQDTTLDSDSTIRIPASLPNTSLSVTR